MSKIHIEQSDIIDAAPETVYAILSDYRVGHPAILPKPYFTELTVEQGGHGAGTVVLTRMKVLGREFVYHQVVSEPEPGRVLLETDTYTGQKTWFTLDPLNGGQQTRCTISSEFPASAGIMGFMERLMQPSVVRRIYKQELQNIAAYVTSKPTSAPTR